MRHHTNYFTLSYQLCGLQLAPTHNIALFFEIVIATLGFNKAEHRW